MNELISSLRLQTAQFNNFLIENYLSGIDIKANNEEYKLYLFNCFFSLSESISTLGSTLAQLTALEVKQFAPLREAITGAVTVIYLIEKSLDLKDLESNIQGINTNSLLYSIESITNYGKKFNKVRLEIDQEIDEIRQDNPGYFNNDGSLKFQTYDVSLQDSITYLIEHAVILQVKKAFKNIKQTLDYFAACLTENKQITTEHPVDPTVLGHLLSTLTLLIIALGYIEPFFQKGDTIVSAFEQYVKDISATQTLIYSSLS